MTTNNIHFLIFMSFLSLMTICIAVTTVLSHRYDALRERWTGTKTEKEENQ